MPTPTASPSPTPGFSALQRAEIAEIRNRRAAEGAGRCFSALQRAEIAEIVRRRRDRRERVAVSVLFNEPKLLKSCCGGSGRMRLRVSVLFNEPKLLKCQAARRGDRSCHRFSALQRAEIAEI